MTHLQITRGGILQGTAFDDELFEVPSHLSRTQCIGSSYMKFPICLLGLHITSICKLWLESVVAQDMVTDIVKKEKAPLTILVGSFWYEQAELFF